MSVWCISGCRICEKPKIKTVHAKKMSTISSNFLDNILYRKMHYPWPKRLWIKVAFCCARPKCRTIIHITAAMNLRGICTKLKSIVNVIWYCENHNMYWKCIFKTSSDFVWQFHTRQQGRPIDNIHISHDFEGDIPEY